MRAIERARWLLPIAMKKKGSSPRFFLRHGKDCSKVPAIGNPHNNSIRVRNHSTTQWRAAEPKPFSQSYNHPSAQSDIQNDSKLRRLTPYLEAYNLMEDNADTIFDHGKMMNERAYKVEEEPLDISNPRPASELPGPKSWPLVGCLPYMIRHKDFDPQRVYLFWRAVRKEFGPIFRKDMPGHPNMIFITEPSDLQKMFQSTMYNPIRPGMQSLKKIRGRGGADGKTNTHYHIFNGKAGTLAEQGDEWWRVRRQVQNPLTNIEMVGRYLPKMNDVASALIQRIRFIRESNNEMPETFANEIYKWALESIGTIALERRLGCLDPLLEESSSSPLRLVHLIKQLLEAFHETEMIKLWQYFPTTSIKRLQEAHDIFTEVALEAIRDTEKLIKAQSSSSHSSTENVRTSGAAACPYHQHHLEGSVSGEESVHSESKTEYTLLETLLRSPALSRGDVLTFLLDMLTTGIDTTSHTASNMLYLLARHPEEQRRLREEIQQVIPDPLQITTQQLYSLVYARAVFRETLRLMPVNVGITRKLVQDTELGGYLIPKGWQVVMPTMLMNFQESMFPRASEFLPERFLRGSPLAPRHNYAFLPFSFGPRMCIGRRIAYQEVMCLIIRILTEFEVDYKYEDINLVNKLSYGPHCPLKFTFIDRK